jgi:hypothetical protein
VRDWRRHGGLDLLLALGAEGQAPPELALVRATLEMRASVGAGAPVRAACRRRHARGPDRAAADPDGAHACARALLGRSIPEV